MLAVISISQPKAQTNGSSPWSRGPESVHCRRTAGQITQQESQPLATRTAQTDKKQAHCLWQLVPGSAISTQRGPGRSLSKLQVHRLLDAVWHSSAPSRPAWVGNEHQPLPPACLFSVPRYHQWSISITTCWGPTWGPLTPDHRGHCPSSPRTIFLLSGKGLWMHTV